MKKLKYLLLLLLLIPINSVHASTINCSAPGSATLGDTITVTFSGNLSSPASVWFAKIGSSDNVTYQSGGLSIDGVDGASMSHTVSFKATSVGNASFYAYDVDVSDGTNSYSDSATCYTNIVAPSSSNSQGSINNVTTGNSNAKSTTDEELSSDATLKKLEVEGVKLNKDFNKDTLEYNVELSSDTTKIKINAESTDENAIISGIGEVEVKEGKNTFSILVTAQNGSSKTYIINAYVQEKSPIVVTVDSKKYTVLKKLVGIETPNGFEKKTIKINNTEVESFFNKKIEYNLVALKDSIGNLTLYIYKKGDYIKYSPLTNEDLNIIVLRAKESEVPHAYKRNDFEYNDAKVLGYALNSNSDFRLVYGINSETGEKGFYLYDIKYHTIQRFYNDQVNLYRNLIQKCKLAFIVLGGFILFLTIIIIILLSKNVKFKKMYLNKRFNKIDNPYFEKKVKYQDLEDTTSIEKYEKKKKKKEKTFLDE